MTTLNATHLAPHVIPNEALRRRLRECLWSLALPGTPRVYSSSSRETITWGESADGYSAAGQADNVLVSRSYLVLAPARGEDGSYYAERTYETFRGGSADPAGELAWVVASTQKQVAQHSSYEECRHYVYGGCEELEATWASLIAAEEAVHRADWEAKMAAESAAIKAFKEADASKKAAEKTAGHATLRASRAGVAYEDVARPNRSSLHRPTAASLTEDAEELAAFCSVIDARIAEALAARGEVEIAAAADEAARKAAIAAAMAAPAGQVPWYLLDCGPSALAFTGRSRGEGFGLRLAGASQWLPGDRSPVAIHFSGGTSRYRTLVSTQGLEALGSLPREIRKTAAVLTGLVADPAWSVAWTHTHDGVATEWFLATAEGATSRTDFEGNSNACGEQFMSRGWGGEEGIGPSPAALRLAHGLTAPLAPASAGRSVPVSKAAQGPTAPIATTPATPASMALLLGKFGKKR